MAELAIAGRMVGDGHPPYFIADVGANHDGELERALRLIDLAAEAGADAVKFQNFSAATIVSRTGFEQLGGQIAHQAAWSKPVYEVYEDASISAAWTPRLAERCRARDVHYFTSPYDLDAVDAAAPFVPALKVGSGDITWTEIIDHMLQVGVPLLLAAGASDQADVDRAMAVVSGHGPGVALMQCNTNYSGDVDAMRHLNLRVLLDWRARFPEVVLGLSDHTPGHLSACAALALGARVFEKHFTDDNARVGPDHGFAMTPSTWAEMVEAVQLVDAALGDGTKRIEANERDAAIVQRRALRYAADLPAGHRLTPADLFPTRPCPREGLPPYRIDELIGRRLRAAVAADELAGLGQLEPGP